MHRFLTTLAFTILSPLAQAAPAVVPAAVPPLALPLALPLSQPAPAASLEAEPLNVKTPAAPGGPLETLPAPTEGPVDLTRVAVLGYHDFSADLPETAMRMRPSKFREQMGRLRQQGITVISLDDFLAWKAGRKTLPERCALITLDDGWRTVHSEALPILKEFGYPYTLFLYKNYIDGGGKALTTAMIREMLKHGASIGSHSVSHPYPATIKAQKKKGTHAFDAFLRKEFGESKRFIESKFPGSITAYAYPGGFVTDEMLPLADEFGYAALFTVLPGKITRESDTKKLPRYMILGNNDRIFEIATTFRNALPIAAEALPGFARPTPCPVSPESGAVINSRLPLITAYLAPVGDLDPATLSMKVSGFGKVPASFDPATRQLTWRVTRRLRQPICQVSVDWLDSAGNKPTELLNWTFRVDRAAAYLPEHTPPAPEPPGTPAAPQAVPQATAHATAQ